MNGLKSVIRPLLVLAFIIWDIDIFAQTTGLIYEPSTGTVLDPNGDGYISANGQAFSTDGDDTDEFEGLSWTRFPTIGQGEKLSDIRSGPEEGFTDFSVDPNGYATYMRIDGSNIIFRFRLADFRPNAKGYTVLIDTDGLIGTEDTDSYVVSKNPGFELGVLLKSKHGVYIIDFDASTSDGSCDALEYSYTLAENHQKSISGIESGGDLDAFYDFYVPLADLYTAGGITSSTGLRFAATTNTSNSCTFQGSISDIGGMDDDGNPCLFCALEELINVQSPTSISDIQIGGLPTACPTLSEEIQASDNVNVAGVASLGATVRIYLNGSLDVVTTADAVTGIYSATLTSIAPGDIVATTAEDVNAGLLESNTSCNEVVVVEACEGGPLLSISEPPGNSSKLDGITDLGLGVLADLEMEIRLVGTTILETGFISDYNTSDGTWEFTMTSDDGDNKFETQEYEARIRNTSSCWSDWVIFCGASNSPKGTIPVINNPVGILTAGSSVTFSGTVDIVNINGVDGAFIYIYQNGIQLASAEVTGVKNESNVAWNKSGVVIGSCGDIEIFSIPRFSGIVSGCRTPEADKAIVPVSIVQSSTPVVTGTYCDPVNTIYGTSSEEEGTIIDVMVNGSSVGNTTVNQFGTWALGGLNILSGSISATAQNTEYCEVQSMPSTPVVISSSPTAPAITWPAVVDEGATSITVTGGSGTQILYIDSSPVTDSNDIPFTSTTGSFMGLSAIGIPESYIYAGGLLSIVQSNGTCTSPESNTKEVECTSPDGSLTVSPASTTITSGSTVEVTISDSEIFTFYQLYDINLGSISGIVRIGNSGDIVLTSSAIATNTTLEVIETRIFPRGCSTTLINTTEVTIGTVTPTISFNTTSSSGDESVASVDLQVDLSAAYGLDVTADYAVTGTATGGGIDYTLANGTLTIPAGSTRENITISGIIDDLLDEADETVIVTLSNPTNATLGVNTIYNYTILDNDVLPTISFNATNSSGDESVASADLQVDLSSTYGLDVTVDYVVTGTAIGGGTDYTLADGTLIIPAGSTSESITIAEIIDDLLDEADETVIVTLSNPTNATLGANTVYNYTIVNNDYSPVLSVVDASIPEGTAAILTASSTDANTGDTKEFSLSGTDALLFNIDPSTGELTFLSIPDFENPADNNKDNIYVIDVIVTDGGGNTDMQSITVTVTGINDNNPVLDVSDAKVNEGNTFVETVFVTDLDVPDAHTFSLEGSDAALFDIDQTTGDLSFIMAPDFENPTDNGLDNIYNLEVVVIDEGGNSDVKSIAVTVVGINDNNPVLIATSNVLIPEGTANVITALASDLDVGDSKTFIISGTDASFFDIDPATGVLTFKSPPDFENALDDGADNIYDLVIEVVDGAGNSDSQAIQVAIAPVNDNDPEISVNDAIVEEGSVYVQTVSVSDGDDSDTHNFTISGADADFFNINPTTGELTFKSGPKFDDPQDSNGDNIYEITVAVSDEAGNTDRQSIQITVDGVPNGSPLAGDDEFTINEGGSINGLSLLSNDSDPDNDNLIINTVPIVNVSHGNLLLQPNGTFIYIPDAEFFGTDSFSYEVCDQRGACAVASVTIIINEINTDFDNDGIPNDIEGNIDTDGDGIPDNEDTDSDNDGILDELEGNTDTDNDGIPDYKDEDSDNDGIPDNEEGDKDTDGDGIPDFQDQDADNDGIPDSEELGSDRFADCDGDGIPNYLDNTRCGVMASKGYSPNGDGENDFWLVEGIKSFPNNNVKVFNRWGNIIFQREGYDNEEVVWIGQSEGALILGESEVPDGTYFYVIDLGNGDDPLSGYIVLKR